MEATSSTIMSFSIQVILTISKRLIKRNNHPLLLKKAIEALNNTILANYNQFSKMQMKKVVKTYRCCKPVMTIKMIHNIKKSIKQKNNIVKMWRLITTMQINMLIPEKSLQKQVKIHKIINHIKLINRLMTIIENNILRNLTIQTILLN